MYVCSCIKTYLHTQEKNTRKETNKALGVCCPCIHAHMYTCIHVHLHVITHAYIYIFITRTDNICSRISHAETCILVCRSKKARKEQLAKDKRDRESLHRELNFSSNHWLP